MSIIQIRSLRAARELAGVASLRVSKIPGSSYSTDSFACHVGSKLALVSGSTCHKCYARRIQSYRDSADKGWTDNYRKATALIAVDPQLWASAIVKQIMHQAKKTGVYFHRWFTAGDLDSVAMLEAIYRVARMTPEIRHWLPTREAKMVKQCRELHGPEPDNLTIRISSTMIDDGPIASHANTSTVHTPVYKGGVAHGKECEAYRTRLHDDGSYEVVSLDEYLATRRGKGRKYGYCGDCRACWDKSVPNVSYGKH